MIVLDTNVVSELMRPAPSDVVLRWLTAQAASELRSTAVTLAEIDYGIECLPEGRRKAAMRAKAEETFATIGYTLLPFDRAAAEEYAALAAARRRIGRPISTMDAQIAAICRAHESVLATRNGVDFDGVGLELVDPWS